MSGGGKNVNTKLVTNVNVTDNTQASTWGWQSISAVSSGSGIAFSPQGLVCTCYPLCSLFLKIAAVKMGLTENMG